MATYVWGIDPGPQQTAIVQWNGEHIRHARILPNEELLSQLRDAATKHALAWDTVAIEMLSCYGQRVGRETFETAVWIGRYQEICELAEAQVTLMERRKVVEHFGVTGKGKDSALIAVLKSRFGEKRKGSVTEKLKSHLWQAFALAVAVQDQISRPANLQSK